MVRKIAAAAAAAALSVSPAVAAPTASLGAANPARALSIAAPARAGTSAKSRSELAGGSGLIVAVLAVAAIVAGVLIISEDDNADSN